MKVSRAERSATNTDLKGERDATDRKLTRKRKAVAEEADAVVQEARDKADRVLAKARRKADQRLAGPRTAPAEAVVAAREVEDASLDDERSTADATVQREREETARVLHALLPLERGKTDRSLLTERARSDEALAGRDEFLNIVSHDLRNLMSGVVMSSALIAARVAGTADGERLLAETQRIQRYAARMNRLIDDLLDVGAMEAGRLGVTLHRGDLSALIDQSVEAFRGAAREAGITIGGETPGKPLLVEHDGDRVLQVLANLIGNAIKFTPAGGTVTVRAESAGDGVLLSVTDTGPGVPEAMREAVFERFRQVGAHDRRGLGLGLYIARGIVESHGGRIWAEAGPGGGSSFRLTLPATHP